VRIAIIGGGIGGLATAIALRQRGIASDVYEAATEITAVGAGIMMSPNAGKPSGGSECRIPSGSPPGHSVGRSNASTRIDAEDGGIFTHTARPRCG